MRINRFLRWPFKQFTGLWLLLRVLTSVVALIPSVLLRKGSTQFTLLELSVPAWPPSFPITIWLDRVFVQPWFRWDAQYYIWATSRGFSIEDGSASFHPLLPLLAKPIFYLTGSPLFALLLVSTLATLALYCCFYRLAQLDLNDELAFRATVLLAIFPGSYVFYAPYTESTFLLFSVLLFYFARQRRWLLAGLCGALATLTRQQGLFLIVPLVMELWSAKERKPFALTSIVFIPLAYGLWIIYRTFALADSYPDLSSFHGLIYSTVISPSAQRVVAEQDFLFPLHALYLALVKLWQVHNVPTITDLVLGAIMVGITIISWRDLRNSYRVYVLIILIVSFGYHTGMQVSSPYMGLPRHLLLAFPVFIGLAPRVTSYAMSKLFKVGVVGMLLLTFFHCLQVWVP
ncbi:MAG TPA: glycosyltransferase family 39 protein [Pyrinomonadaceae bacterium]|nr:glycosyltransferase family 39 protein [Pyrinomonadaceae bacterium]